MSLELTAVSRNASQGEEHCRYGFHMPLVEIIVGRRPWKPIDDNENGIKNNNSKGSSFHGSSTGSTDTTDGMSIKGGQAPLELALTYSSIEENQKAIRVAAA